MQYFARIFGTVLIPCCSAKSATTEDTGIGGSIAVIPAKGDLPEVILAWTEKDQDRPHHTTSLRHIRLVTEDGVRASSILLIEVYVWLIRVQRLLVVRHPGWEVARRICNALQRAVCRVFKFSLSGCPTEPNQSQQPPDTEFQLPLEERLKSSAPVHKIHSLGKVGLVTPKQLGAATLRGLLLGCVSDLRTCLFRMGKRFGKLPAVYSAELGPAIQRDANGHLQPNTRTHGCIADIRSFEASHRGATVFDVEVFRQGWERGARWSADMTGQTCRLGQDKTA
jgi:hypothetical protein